jgi:N-acetylmuramoyl-L-alanine amidase
MIRPIGWVLAGVLLALPALAAERLAKVETQNTRTGTHPDLTRVVLDVSALSKFFTTVTDDGRRVMVGIPAIDWEANRHRLRPHGLVARYDFVKRGMKKGLLVIYTNAPARIEYKFTLPPDPADGKGNRLVIDLAPRNLPGKARMPPRVEPRAQAPATKTEAGKPAAQKPDDGAVPPPVAAKAEPKPEPEPAPPPTPVFPVPIKTR